MRFNCLQNNPVFFVWFNAYDSHIFLARTMKSNGKNVIVRSIIYISIFYCKFPVNVFELLSYKTHLFNYIVCNV